MISGLRRSDILLVLRFGLVGIAATAAYLGLGLLLIETGFLPLVIGNALAFTAAVLVSYLGHHRFTFRADGEHGFHFPRFVAITVTLFLASNMLLLAAVERFALRPVVGMLLVAVLYPLASFALHNAWTFPARRRRQSLRTGAAPDR